MSLPRSLTARLVLTTTAIALLVSLLVGTATTFAVRSYLTGQLDQDVARALERSERGRDLGFPDGPGPGHGGPDRGPGDEVGTLSAGRYDDTEPAWVGTVLTQGPRGLVEQVAVTDEVSDQLDGLPSDGEPHEVDLAGLGSYRVAVSAEGTVAAGLPTADVDDAVANLLAWEAVLALAALLAGGGAALVVVRRQLRPLREVAATAHTVADLPLATGDIRLAERVPAHLTDERTEVGQVGAALDALLAHVETALRARHRSEQQVRRFVADASHELRTPLATIAGYTELARRRPDDPADAATALDKVEEEAARMTALVEDLLLLARLDAGRPLAREPVDLTRLLLEATEDARVLAPDHHWRLELPEESVEVIGDELRLHQVVTNLLTNARTHTPPGTTVTVRGTAHGFAVSDDGPGFPPELADTAFERFVRGDASRTRGGGSGGGTGGGTGLGLALVAAIVAAHGGTVGLASRPGHTTIEVTLPAP
ncbi:sensor histidine kinase [Nocardioides marmotae]|uniref:sensor histidine kinase n=1 Tax=Nocardioides marmotae TaxID=2663857 RepID=UPI0012B55220|nr:HAMP domain-containing sensor histidine kinase [Nocardioides marmotae]MBC9734547.1 HAMP domain-containing histidine kinase [Nocardioides marmotae]MTB85648.1 HAMP domain-containing protein [Nocardioides marmotae]